MNYEKRLEEARKIADIFEITKDIVREFLGVEQAGLMIGMSDLGMSRHGFVGAFYSLNANMIILNRRALQKVMQASPSLHKHYTFYLLLHEYIHSIGAYDEEQARQLAIEIAQHFFGLNHPVSQLAANITEFLQGLALTGDYGEVEAGIEFVHGIDRKNTDYIN